MDPRDFHDAMLAGAIAALVMSLIGAFFRRYGIGLGPEAAWAALFGLGSGPLGWWLGFIVHVIAGAIVGIAYGWMFEVLYQFADHWFVGVVVGMIHAAVFGFLLGLSPKVRPVLFGVVEGEAFGMSMPNAVAWVSLHAIFGIIMYMMLEEVEGRRRIHRYLPTRFGRRAFD
jgi:hypothetical protein